MWENPAVLQYAVAASQVTILSRADLAQGIVQI